MTNPPAQQSNFGLVAWLEQTRVALPLKGVECQFQITGDVACVELDQIYHQNASKPLDCAYTFPLPAGAAVYRCEVHINGRVIRAKVEDQETARDIYRTRKAEGRRTALVEMERENLFTLSLGNVQPGDVIVVCFAWFQVLDRVADELRLMVPTCPGVRYIPGKPLLRSLSGRGTVDDTDQVPDASRITPPRIDALHPDAAYFCIEGRLSGSDVEPGTASSPSHPLLVRETEGAITVELSGRAAVPDRDFVLIWKEPKVVQLAPQAWRWNEGTDTYALVQLRAPEDVKLAVNLPQDFYFLVDRSGSMQGAKWQKSCEALRAFVGLLAPEDRVWITLFESNYVDFDVAPMPAPGVLADEGFQNMEEIGTDGGTELLPAAKHLLEKVAEHSAGRRTTVILITDGQIGNEGAVLRAFKSAAKVAVHTFGIDTAVNDAVLKSLARQHRGGCWLQTPNDDIAGTVAALGDRLRRPVLSDLAVNGSWETADGNLPDLHAREVVTVAMRGNAGSPVEISGRLPDGTAHSFVVDAGSHGSEAVKLLWARQRISALLESGCRQEAIAMARTHNLICDGAAFIAWDEQELVPIAKDEVVQPVLESHVECLLPARGNQKVPKPSVVNRVFSLAGRLLSKPQERRIFAPSFPSGPRARGDGGSGHGEEQSPDERNERLREEAVRDRNARLAGDLAALREALQREGIPESDIGDFVAWAERDDALERTASLNQAMDLIAGARQQLGTVFDLDLSFRDALHGSPEALLAWAAQFRPIFDGLLKLQRKWKTRIRQDRFERLMAWVAESGRFDPSRLREVLKFAESLDRGPFSAGSMERRWREFLDASIDVPSR